MKPIEILHRLNLLSGSTAADLGCGAGYFVFPLARIVGPAGKVYAVDVQKCLLNQLKREVRAQGFDNIQIIWSDIETVGATSISPNSLDVVLLINTLFQITNKDAVLHEARRLLKDNGLLLVVDWILGDTGVGPAITRRLNLANLRQIIVRANFVENTHFLAGEHHFGLIAKAI